MKFNTFQYHGIRSCCLMNSKTSTDRGYDKNMLHYAFKNELNSMKYKNALTFKAKSKPKVIRPDELLYHLSLQA